MSITFDAHVRDKMQREWDRSHGVWTVKWNSKKTRASSITSGGRSGICFMNGMEMWALLLQLSAESPRY